MAKQTHNIAAYNGFPFHYEMIGIVLNFSQDIPIFTNFDHDLGWIEYYKTRFPLARFHHHTEFIPENFDRVVLLTDDDHAFPFNNGLSMKILCIDHLNKKRVFNDAIFLHLSTRYFDGKDGPWAIPTFNMIPKDRKKIIVRESQRLGVACIGGTLSNMDMNGIENQLRSLFVNYDDIDFYMMGRRTTVGMLEGQSRPNIFIKCDVSTTDLVLTLQGCDYVLMLIPACHDGRLHEGMSGSIPLAFNSGCRIIMPNKEYMDAYKLASPLLIESNPVTLQRLTDADIEAVYSEASDQEKRFRDAMMEFLR